MKRFFSIHSYNMVKMFLNQFATAIFGFVLALAAGYAKNTVLRNITSVGAILFYLFLLYTSLWEKGSKDHIAVEYRRKPYRPWLGLQIALLANSINLVLGILISIGAACPDGSGFFDFAQNCRSFAILLQGMYTGILAIPGGSVQYLNQLWFVYLLIPLPALLVSWLGYYFGVKNIKFTKFFDAKPTNKPEE